VADRTDRGLISIRSRAMLTSGFDSQGSHLECHLLQTTPDISAAGAHYRGKVYTALAGIFLLNLLLRIFYARFQFINGDEAIRALTALRMLDGGRLYVGVMTDKPPGSTLFYEAVLSIFKHSMLAVHIAAIVWNFGTAIVLYFIGKRFYSKVSGLWAALLFVYFSTNYFPPDTMAANTELLLVLPYAMSFYAWLVASPKRFAEDSDIADSRGRPAALWWLFPAGFFTGVSVSFKQIGILNLVFFLLYEIVGSRLNSGMFKLSVASQQAAGGYPPGSPSLVTRPTAKRIVMLIAGFAAPMAFLAGWLCYTGALGGFWRNTIVLEAFYLNSLPDSIWIKFMVQRTFGYVLFNLALWSLASWALWKSLSKRKQGSPVTGGTPISVALTETAALDLSIGLWGLMSLCGVFAGGRFYGHYFIPVLPALSLLGARGLEHLRAAARVPETRKRARVAVTVLLAIFLFSFVRFHDLTAALAYESLTGKSTSWVKEWGVAKRETEAASVATTVSNEIGEGGYLYIWGYALEVYWRSGCRPASRYLTPYYVTGHFYPEVTAATSTTSGKFWDDARTQFIDDLRTTKPRLILNIDEPIQSLPYPDIIDFINENYTRDATIGPNINNQFIVYRLKNAK
jgi:hypothetical protein